MALQSDRFSIHDVIPRAMALRDIAAADMPLPPARHYACHHEICRHFAQLRFSYASRCRCADIAAAIAAAAITLALFSMMSYAAPPCHATLFSFAAVLMLPSALF
jgi:hypothetical protein